MEKKLLLEDFCLSNWLVSNDKKLFLIILLKATF